MAWRMSSALVVPDCMATSRTRARVPEGSRTMVASGNIACFKGIAPWFGIGYIAERCLKAIAYFRNTSYTPFTRDNPTSHG